MRIPIAARDFSVLHVFHTDSDANPASHSMGTGFLGRGHEINNSPPLAPRRRMFRAVLLLPYMVSWCRQGQFYLYLMLQYVIVYLQAHDNQ